MFWHTVPCSPVKLNQRFEGIYRLCIQGLRITQARKQHEAGRGQALLGFLLGLPLDLENGGDMFLRKVGFHWLGRCYIPEI
jgi:hypothetical protein